MLVLSFLLLFLIILLIIVSRKYNKLKKRLIITDNDLIANFIKYYDEFKNKVLISDTTELRSVIFTYFSLFDNLVTEYFYPKIGVDESEEDEE